MNPIHTKLDSLNQSWKSKLKLFPNKISDFEIQDSKLHYVPGMIGKKVEYFVVVFFEKRSMCFTHLQKCSALSEMERNRKKFLLRSFFCFGSFLSFGLSLGNDFRSIEFSISFVRFAISMHCMLHDTDFEMQTIIFLEKVLSVLLPICI